MTSLDDRATLAAQFDAALEAIRAETGRHDVWELVAREPDRYSHALALAVKLFARAELENAYMPTGADGNSLALPVLTGEAAARVFIAAHLMKPPLKGGEVSFPYVFEPGDDLKKRYLKGRDMKIAFAVCELIVRRGMTRKAAVAAVAPRFHLGSRALEKAYDTHRAIAEPVVKAGLI